MKIIESVEEMASLCCDVNSVFAPTMGALHQGHVALLREARKDNLGNKIISSLFVNPLQFSDHSDYSRYPATLKKDLEIFESEGVDLLFIPRKEEILKPGTFKVIDPGPLGDIFEGKFRRGHFAGVLTIVNRLFEIVAPRKAIFGEKDLQQLCLIRQVLNRKDLEIISVPIVRDTQGLALSSRNQLLSKKSKKQATIIFKSLMKAKEIWNNGEDKPKAIKSSVENVLNLELNFETQYVGVVDPYSFKDLYFQTNNLKRMAVVVAGFIDNIRLIDNVIIGLR